MCAAKKRIELFVEVFDLLPQRAHALTDLTPVELIAAILQELRDNSSPDELPTVECLDSDPTRYRLVRATTGAPLNEGESIETQLKEGDHIRLEELHVLTPSGARPVDADLYLRELASGRVFKLNWLPAIIGRDDPHQPNNQLVAANLAPFKGGLRVSRRHARIIEEDGQYHITLLSSNPASLRNGDQRQQLAASQSYPLKPGDVIVFDRSEIALKFIVRGDQRAQFMSGQTPTVRLDDAPEASTVNSGT